MLLAPPPSPGPIHGGMPYPVLGWNCALEIGTNCTWPKSSWDTGHCHGALCFQRGAILCECRCDSCALAERLLVKAREEILGEDW